MNFPPDSEEQCGGRRTGEVAGPSHKELSFRTAKQRTHSSSKKQTSTMLEVDKLNEVAKIYSSSHLHHLLESDDISGETSEPCFFCVCLCMRERK